MNYTLVSYFDIFENDNWSNFEPTVNSRKKLNKFIRGAYYRLKTGKKKIDSSILFENAPDRIYQLKTILNQWNGQKMDCVIMKQVQGPTDHKMFSLSKQQCQAFHLKFEHGLEIFSQSGNRFQRIIQRFPINDCQKDENDLSTYYHSLIDGTIREIFIRLDDYKFINNFKKVVNKISKKNYKIYSDKNENLLLGGLEVKSKKCLKTPNGKLIYKPKDLISYCIERNYNDETDTSVYLRLVFIVCTEGCFTEDGWIGIDKQQLKEVPLKETIEFLNLKE